MRGKRYKGNHKGNLWSNLTDFLKLSTQKVILNAHLSLFTNIDAVIPQGSILELLSGR